MARAVRRPPPVPEQWRNRIVGHGEMTADEFLAHPDNPKNHPGQQATAVTTILGEIGWVAPLIVNQRTGRMLDGHLRADLAVGKGMIPFVYVDLSEEEERTVLAMLDPVGAMATYDPDVMARLTADLPPAIDMTDILQALLPPAPATDDPVAREHPMTVSLHPLRRAHVLISVPLDQWPEVSAMLDEIADTDGIEITSTVN